MADTVTLPAVGPVKKDYLMAGGALVAGIVGYAWYQRGRADAAPAPVVVPPEAIADDERITPPSGNSNQNVDLRDPGIITSNAQWTQRATEYLANIGYEPQLVSGSLGKYFARQGLTPQEMDVVRAAVAAFGVPPMDGPWPIQPALPAPAPTVPAAVTGLKVVGVTAKSVTIGWDPVPGATGYHIDEHSDRGKSTHDIGGTVLLHNYGGRGLVSDLNHHYTVYAVNAHGRSEGRSITARTAKA